MANCEKCGGEMRDGRNGVCVLCKPSERRPRTTTRDGVSGSMTNDMGPAAIKTREMVENLAEELDKLRAELDELRAELSRLREPMGKSNV